MADNLNKDPAYIEDMFMTAFENDEDEVDFLTDFFDKGYTLDDLKYNPERYKWAVRLSSEHGLLSESEEAALGITDPENGEIDL